MKAILIALLVMISTPGKAQEQECDTPSTVAQRILSVDPKAIIGLHTGVAASKLVNFAVEYTSSEIFDQVDKNIVVSVEGTNVGALIYFLNGCASRQMVTADPSQVARVLAKVLGRDI